jgi:PAS domain S-box-containing protein
MRRSDGQSGEGERVAPLDPLELDARGTILSIDAQLLRDLGQTRAELIGKSAIELIDPRDRDDVVSLIRRVVDGERPGQAIFRVLRPDGTVRWIEASVRPYRTDDGLLRLGVMARDVTERVSIEEVLRDQMDAERRIGRLSRSALALDLGEQASHASDLRLRTMAEYVDDVVCESNAQGVLSYCSPGVERLLGYPADELPASELMRLVHPEDLARLQRHRRELFAADTELVVAFRLRHLRGDWVWLEVKGRSFCSASGERVAVHVVRDVTKREQEREALQQKVALESLLSNLSREILVLGVDEIDDAIERALASVALAARADRCLFVAVSPGLPTGAVVYEWADEGIPTYREALGLEQIEAFDWCMRQLRDGQIVQIGRMEDFPIEAVAERRAFEALGLCSLLSIPTCPGGELVGMLTLQTERHHARWTEHELTFLRIVSELITGTLRRKRNELALRDSEERYRSLAENARDCILEMDARGNALYVSPSLVALLGWEPEALQGKGSHDLVHPDDFDQVQQAFLAALRGVGVDAFLYRAVHADGSHRHLEAKAQAYRSSSGEQRIVATIRDVTERERSKAMLERQLDLESRVAEFSRYFLDLEMDEIEAGVHERLADLARIAGAEHALFYTFSNERRSTRSSEREAGIEAFEWWDTGLEERSTFALDFDHRSYPWTFDLFMRRQPIHVPTLEALPAEARAERRAFEARGVRSMLGIPVVVAGQSVGFLGFETLSHEHSWSDEVIPLFRLAGEIFVSALRRRRAEWMLRESQQSLLQSQKMEAVGRLAGGIAHDFNNHLAVMLGNARFLRHELEGVPESAEDSDLADALRDLERSAEHCSQLTRSLLTFSRRSPVDIRPLDVRSMVSSVTELVGPLIPASIALEARTEEDVESVAADSTQLQQVLVNLILNARDAMPEGGRIELSARMRAIDEAESTRLSLPRAGRYVELGVRDCGVGIGEDSLEHIFEPFYTTKDVGKGTGLGLATAYGIVEQSQGVIDVESELGVGTHFRVLLPASLDQENVAEPVSSEPVDGGTGTVLVVEDHASVRRLLHRILEGAGYRVLETSNGSEALDLADGHAGRIDLLLTDLNMPGMDGLELAEQLSASRPNLRVLVLSGDCTCLEQQIQARVPGGRCMQKPFKREALLSEVRAAVEAGGG